MWVMGSCAYLIDFGGGAGAGGGLCSPLAVLCVFREFLVVVLGGGYFLPRVGVGLGAAFAVSIWSRTSFLGILGGMQLVWCKCRSVRGMTSVDKRLRFDITLISRNTLYTYGDSGHV